MAWNTQASQYASLHDPPYQQAVKALLKLHIKTKLVETWQNRGAAPPGSGISRKDHHKILKRSTVCRSPRGSDNSVRC